MDTSDEIFQLAEVKRRVAEVESGRVESDEDEGIAEALRRDAELESAQTAAMSLAEIDSYIQGRRQ